MPFYQPSHKKISCRMFEASTYPKHIPQEKNQCELRGWKKIHAHTKSPPPPFKVKWLAPNDPLTTLFRPSVV